tara:strand:- start:498 stop:1103 length:606 start_codon:yes stop_codon:yes gene_type:complete
MKFNQHAFNNFILDHDVVKEFETPITLKSGKKSNLYVNWRTVAEDAYLMDQLSDFILAFHHEKQLDIDTFYGVPEGATKLGIITQFKFAKQNKWQKSSHQLAMGRAKPKEHGDPKDRLFVGAPRGNICVLEDVTTTGGSLITCIENLKHQGYPIAAAIGLTNRDEFRDDGKSVKKALADLGTPYYEMSNAKEILAAKQKSS